MSQIELVDLKDKTVMVLGGNGFIGKHISACLRLNGARVVIGTRASECKLNPYERRVRFHEMLNKDQWLDVLAGIDMVVNAVGILRERKGESFEHVHHHAVKALAEACSGLGVKLIHMSAIGLHEGLHAAFSVTKKKGEQEIIRSMADWHIIRASLVEGEGAYGAGWFKKVAQWPIHFIPEKYALLSPVNVSVICQKVLELLSRETVRVPLYHRIHEVSNGVDYLLPDYLLTLNGGKKRPRLYVPDGLVRFATKICDLLNLTPLTYGHYELLTYDSCPSGSAR